MNILLFANTDWYLYNFRLALAKTLCEQGYRVVLVSPKGSYASRLQEIGFRWIQFNFARRGLNPIIEGTTILRLMLLYLRERPDIVHHFTVKCVLYGSLAANMVGIETVVNSVPGLGYAFTDGESSRLRLRWLIMLFYRIALRGTRVIFQNPDDQAFFVREGLVDVQQTVLIQGSGVDIVRFSPGPQGNGVPLVILPARLLWDKGVEEFVSAARMLQAEGIQARFALVGKGDPDNPASIPDKQLEEWGKSGVIEWWGWMEDMDMVYAQAHIVCLPSYYKEGLPKTLIEAAACGKPIIASDMPGCREIVRPDENGLLVPQHDPLALADAMRTLIQDPARRKRMGERSREMVKEEFSEEKILTQTLKVYSSL